MSGENTLPSGLVKDPDRGPAVLSVSWIECIIAITFVVARMFTRSRLIHNVGSDDWFMVATLVSLNEIEMYVQRRNTDSN